MRRGALALITLILAACGAAPRRPPATSAASSSDPEAEAATAETTAALVEDDLDDEGEAEPAESPAAGERCPRNMVLVDGAFCIDKYEAAVVEVHADGTETPYPHYLAVDGHAVRAISEPGVYPQGYISELQAEEACAASGKRLCSYPEWKSACTGSRKTTFPYGDTRRAGVCHDSGRSAVVAVFGAKAVAASPVSAIIAAANAPKASRPAHSTTKRRVAKTTRPRPSKNGSKRAATKKGTGKKRTAARSAHPSPRPADAAGFNVWTQLNDARLGRVEGALARTGEHPGCESESGALDMVGNLHEWVKTDASAAHGTFAGGYYLDTSQNGDGCNYKTQAHAHDYHDYSTGFRCCADPGAGEK